MEEKWSQKRDYEETQRLANTRKYFYPWARMTPEGGSVAWTQRLGHLSVGSWSHGWDSVLPELMPKARNEETHPHPSPPPVLLISLLCLPSAKLSHRYGSLRNADHMDQPSPPNTKQGVGGRRNGSEGKQVQDLHRSRDSSFIVTGVSEQEGKLQLWRGEIIEIWGEDKWCKTVVLENLDYSSNILDLNELRLESMT